MTAATLAAVENAVRAHLATIREDAVLTDWFLSFGSIRHDPESGDGISYGTHYVASDTSPQGALGIAHVGVGNLARDLLGPDI